MRALPYTPLLGAALAVSCGAGGAHAVKPPAWFESCPKSTTALYFCADADGATEALAKELAAHKALGQLTIYVGATVKSDERIRDVEHNGVTDQEVSATVDVAGTELVIKEASLKKVAVEPAGGGQFTSWAMIEWPRAQYEAILAAQRAGAVHALEVFLEAEKAATELDVNTGRDKLKEARALLGPTKNATPLPNDKYPNTTVLLTAMDALDTRMNASAAERSRVCAVGLLCSKDGSSVPCRASRVGAFRESVAHAGRKVSSEAIAAETIAAILDSATPKVDAKLRSAGCIVAVRLTADLLEAGSPFTFVSTGARAVIYDTATNRILETHEVRPSKVGHVSFDGAMQKGFDELEKQLAEKISASLAKGG
jgi:hypothetical protein